MDRHAQDWGGEVSILRCHVTVTAWILAMSTSNCAHTKVEAKRNESEVRMCNSVSEGPGVTGLTMTSNHEWNRDRARRVSRVSRGTVQ